MNTTTWHSLVTAARKNQIDPNPYTYVYVSQTQPESLKLYINNYLFFSTAVNTGISVAPRPTAPSRCTCATPPRRCRVKSQTVSPTTTPESLGLVLQRW